MEETKSADGRTNHPIAFLIVGGARLITLDTPVTNIGRKSDNQVVINNEHVSRSHAQIKKVNDEYILLDLKSTVGTSVNGKRIDQIVLQPGDVISLGGVPIIFGQGNPNTAVESQNLDRIINSDSRPTEKTDLQSADQYLDFFNTADD